MLSTTLTKFFDDRSRHLGQFCAIQPTIAVTIETSGRLHKLISTGLTVTTVDACRTRRKTTASVLKREILDSDQLTRPGVYAQHDARPAACNESAQLQTAPDDNAVLLGDREADLCRSLIGNQRQDAGDGDN